MTALQRSTPLRKRTLKKKVCEQCGDEYLGYRIGQRFCGKRCSGLANPDVGRRQTAKFEAEIAEIPTRRIKTHLVYFPEDGTDPFVIRVRSNGVRHKARGHIRACVKCGSDYFWAKQARQDQQHCSKKCSGVEARKRKRKAAALKGPNKGALDNWFSMIVRSVGHCAFCGTTERLQCAHIVSRRYLGVRWDFANAICLCASCHLRFTHRPLEWEEYVVGLIGEGAYLNLKRRALAFVGPVDRTAVSTLLYAVAEEKGLKKGSAPGVGFGRGSAAEDVGA